jgi:hypothetical protein
LYLYRASTTLDGNLISNNVALENSGSEGGGLYLRESSAVLRGNTIRDNWTDAFWGTAGGGLGMDRSQALLINNVVANNEAKTWGSGLYSKSSSSSLLHNTIARNPGTPGSRVAGIFIAESSSMTLSNTILVGHAVGIYMERNTRARLEATLWGTASWANETDWEGPGTISIGTINLWGDPGFVDPLSSRDYHILPDSAAVDKGINAGVNDDIDGDPRPQCGFFDIGADELLTGSWCHYRVYLPLWLEYFGRQQEGP